MRLLGITHPPGTRARQHRQPVRAPVARRMQVPGVLLPRAAVARLPLLELRDVLLQGDVPRERRVEGVREPEGLRAERAEAAQDLPRRHGDAGLRRGGERGGEGGREGGNGLRRDGDDRDLVRVLAVWVRVGVGGVGLKEVEYLCVGLQGDEYGFGRGDASAAEV